MTKMRQVIINSDDCVQTVWVEDIPELKKGCEITLKEDADPKRLWKIIKVFSTIVDKNTLHKPWRVGGLS